MIYATHLMGGEFRYTLTGTNSQLHLNTYKITLHYYRYCEPGAANFQPFYEINICIDSSNANYKRWMRSVYLNKISTSIVTPPPFDSTCNFSFNACIEAAVYEEEIILSSDTSWHLLMYDGSRNGSVLNIVQPDSTGMCFYIRIPAQLNNSSPQFLSIPTPFLCAGDTFIYNNSVFDQDGDQLVFKLVHPYGTANSMVNTSFTDSNFNLYYLFPLPTVLYNPGYSQQNPFGAGGICSINASTGAITMKVPNQGYYVIAIEVEEYRNNILLSRSRRDVQIVVAACPQNTAPQLLSPLMNNYHITEGDTLCFPLVFSDADSNMISIRGLGSVFDTLIANPPATLTTNFSANGSAIVDFCWNTICGQYAPSPYLFSIEAYDDGCPPRLATYVFSVTVDSVSHQQVPTVQLNMNPDTAVCSYQPLTFQATTTFAGNHPQFEWLINGQVVSNQISPLIINGLQHNDHIQVKMLSNSVCVIQQTAWSNIVVAQILQQADASFTADPAITNLFNPVITFNNTSLNHATCYWRFGDGDTSVAIRPQHAYQYPDTFMVMLIAESNDGCIDTAQSEVVVREISTYYLPSSFTPDNNGLNDGFGLLGENIPPHTLQIYSRWGQLLFSETGKPVWDGSYKNKIMPQGVYLYTVRFNDNHKPLQKTGTVMLMR